MGYTPPQLEVRKITGGWGVYPPTATTTDDITLYPNTADATAYIKLDGLGAVTLATASSSGVLWKEGATSRGIIYYSSPDFIIESYTTDKNIFLKTTGTGVLKFGTYTAGAATDSTGFITVLDAAGNTRKLMVQA